MPTANDDTFRPCGTGVARTCCAHALSSMSTSSTPTIRIKSSLPACSFDIHRPQFTTFEKRVLYDVIDVTQLLHDGCNTFGIMLGHGWFAQPTVKSGARQFLLMLSVTAADGSVTYYPSSLAGNDEDRRNGDHRSTTTSASTIVPLTFQATAGPVVQDDIYVGESYGQYFL